MNVIPNNELKCPVPDSRFNTMHSDLFEKIDYDKAAALTNNSNVDAVSAETVINKDKEHNTETGDKETENQDPGTTDESDPNIEKTEPGSTEQEPSV